MSTRDYTSIHNVKDFILNQIAPNYFDIDDISLLNTGLFGMITDISGTVIEDNFNATSRYITELIPGKSRLPEFIYAYAANYGVTDVFCTCSRCSALLFIKEADVLANGKKEGNTSTYIIDADLTVYVEDVPFSIPYNIRIISNYYNGKYNHRCYYDMNMKNDAATGNLPYIKCGKTTVTGEKIPYLAINVTLMQYKRNRTVEQIITNNILNIPYIDASFSDNLCNFELLYKENENSNKIQLTKILERGIPISKPFAFYKSINDNAIRLSFANDDAYFIPTYNSEIEILTYESLGSGGNMPKYTGDDIYVTCSSEETELAYNNEVSMYCVMLSDCEGGKDGLTMDQVSALTAEKRLTVNSITTDSDLDQYFSTYAMIYDTYAKFIKFRDDLVSREYSCYTRLRNDDEVFPTNTVDVDVNLSRLPYETDVNSNRIIVKAGTRIGYVGDSIDQCEVMNDGDEPRDIEYTTLGLTSITKYPTMVSSYMNSIDKTIPVTYSYINDFAIRQFLLQKLQVTRNAAIGEEYYTIEILLTPSDMTIMSNTIDEDATYDEDYVPDVEGYENPIIEDTDDQDTIVMSRVHVYLFVETDSGHYMEMVYDPDNSSEELGYTFRCQVGTTDITNQLNIELTGLTHCETQQPQNCYTSMQNPPIRIVIAYDESDTEKNHEYSKLIPALSKSTICNVFVPLDESLYFAYPLSLIKSTVEFVPSKTESTGYTLRIYDLPVVGREYIANPDNMEQILDRVNSQHEFLSSVQITSNYSINMKFFNTYGRSRIFTVTTGALLNRVNCDVDLSIKFKLGVVETDYMDQIKLTIKNYIESFNESSSTATGVNDIRVSALIALLHNNYPDQIEYIVMNSLNGYGPEIQTIIMGLDLSLSENMYTIPEFLTINVENIKVTVL